MSRELEVSSVSYTGGVVFIEQQTSYYKGKHLIAYSEKFVSNATRNTEIDFGRFFLNVIFNSIFLSCFPLGSVYLYL